MTRRSLGNIITLCFFVFIATTLTGCGTGSTAVIKPVSDLKNNSRSVSVNEVSSKVAVPEKALEQIRRVLINRLKNNRAVDVVTDGDGAVILDVEVIRFETGDQLARWVSGGGGEMGKGEIILETTYIDSRSRQEIGKIKTHGDILAGFFGGSMDTAYSNSIQEIVEYTAEKFGDR